MKKLKVKDIMSRDLTCVTSNTSISNIAQLFTRRNIHHVLVENEDGELTGIISSEDLARMRSKLFEDKLTASHIMTAYPITIHDNESIKKANSHFLNNQYRALPVMNDNEELVGIITPFDLLELYQKKI